MVVLVGFCSCCVFVEASVNLQPPPRPLRRQEYMIAVGWRWAEGNKEGDLVFGPLATWVERETAGCMIQHLLMGFELDLYEPKEYTMIYW